MKKYLLPARNSRYVAWLRLSQWYDFLTSDNPTHSVFIVQEDIELAKKVQYLKNMFITARHIISLCMKAATTSAKAIPLQVDSIALMLKRFYPETVAKRYPDKYYTGGGNEVVQPDFGSELKQFITDNNPTQKTKKPAISYAYVAKNNEMKINKNADDNTSYTIEEVISLCMNQKIIHSKIENGNRVEHRVVAEKSAKWGCVLYFENPYGVRTSITGPDAKIIGSKVFKLLAEQQLQHQSAHEVRLIQSYDKNGSAGEIAEYYSRGLLDDSVGVLQNKPMLTDEEQDFVEIIKPITNFVEKLEHDPYFQINSAIDRKSVLKFVDDLEILMKKRFDNEDSREKLADDSKHYARAIEGLVSRSYDQSHYDKLSTPKFGDADMEAASNSTFIIQPKNISEINSAVSRLANNNIKSVTRFNNYMHEKEITITLYQSDESIIKDANIPASWVRMSSNTKKPLIYDRNECVTDFNNEVIAFSMDDKNLSDSKKKIDNFPVAVNAAVAFDGGVGSLEVHGKNKGHLFFHSRRGASPIHIGADISSIADVIESSLPGEPQDNKKILVRRKPNRLTIMKIAHAVLASIGCQASFLGTDWTTATFPEIAELGKKHNTQITPNTLAFQDFIKVEINEKGMTKVTILRACELQAIITPKGKVMLEDYINKLEKSIATRLTLTCSDIYSPEEPTFTLQQEVSIEHVNKLTPANFKFEKSTFFHRPVHFNRGK